MKLLNNYFDKQHFLIVVVSILIYFITAIHSHGYYHADEHYQLIEFAGIKSGTHTPEELAWEYNAQLRPTLQPTIGVGVLYLLRAVGLNNPYNKALVFRLLTAFLALIVISIFVKNTLIQFSNHRLRGFYILFSYLLWYIPFMSVRFSSETWAGLMFLLALAFIENKKYVQNKLFLTGMILGLSFLFRFQMGFLIVCVFVWLFYINKISFSQLLKIFSGITSIILLGSVLDSWFYEEIVFTPWNYFMSFFNTGGKSFGSEPWYYYFSRLLVAPTLFIGIPVLASIAILLIKEPKNLFLWCFLVFIAIHSLIPHKEVRFLFPIVFLIPVILIKAYTHLSFFINRNRILHLLQYLLIFVFLIVNSTGLIVMTQKSAGIGRMEITKYIHENYTDKPINLIFASWSNPYNPWQSIPAKFYLEKNMISHEIRNLCALNDSLVEAGAHNILVFRKINFEKAECKNFIQSNGFEYKLQSIPVWVEYLNKYYNGFDSREIIVLYEHN
ncbi:MAG: hypothetical protein CVT92_14250 [Bacteroidetes bacterium HGW-Bacteroidetes-1]|jgi:phosphatidylinositol glycan class B|nr:MAG: hypothetical protein CVT92_14250 [Bacteroidetes bacterium HGW-Bacteroidetes-1]